MRGTRVHSLRCSKIDVAGRQCLAPSPQLAACAQASDGRSSSRRERIACRV